MEVANELMTFGKERFVRSNGAEFYVETFTSPPTILIAGGGHVAKALYTIGKTLGFPGRACRDGHVQAGRLRQAAANGRQVHPQS